MARCAEQSSYKLIENNISCEILSSDLKFERQIFLECICILLERRRCVVEFIHQNYINLLMAELFVNIFEYRKMMCAWNGSAECESETSVIWRFSAFRLAMCLMNANLPRLSHFMCLYLLICLKYHLRNFNAKGNVYLQATDNEIFSAETNTHTHTRDEHNSNSRGFPAVLIYSIAHANDLRTKCIQEQ